MPLLAVRQEMARVVAQSGGGKAAPEDLAAWIEGNVKGDFLAQPGFVFGLFQVSTSSGAEMINSVMGLPYMISSFFTERRTKGLFCFPCVYFGACNTHELTGRCMHESKQKENQTDRKAR